MKTASVVNIGTIVTGDLKAPFADGRRHPDAGRRASARSARCRRTQVSSADVVIDAAGTTAIPGLIDSHVHITFGDYTPTAARGRLSRKLRAWRHDDVDHRVRSALCPDRPKDPAGVKALALAARACFLDYRPGGMRVHAGSIILEPGLTEGRSGRTGEGRAVARQGRLRRLRDTVRLCAA